MATPEPQVDNSLPRRTTIQPTVPLGPVAGSQKVAGGVGELKKGELPKPEPIIEKPAPRMSFAAAAAASAPITATAAVTSSAPKAGAVSATAPAQPGNDAKIETPAISDWGLAVKKPRQRGKFKVAAGILLALSAAGGYAAYTRLAANSSAAEEAADNPADNGAEVARSDDLGDPNPGADLSGGGDPFDEGPEDTPAANIRTTASVEPRRVGNVPDAQPIASRNSPGRVPKTNSLRESLELDDEAPANEADDADLRIADQSEPDPADDVKGPALGESPDVPRRLSTAGRGDKLPDEMLDDYSVAGKRTAGKSKGASPGPAISIVEAHDDSENDEKYSGYVPQDATTRRATSKTVVVRPTDEATRDEPPLAPEIDVDRTYSNAAVSSTNGRERRSSPPVPPANGRFLSPPAAGASPAQVSGPASDTYRVAADDNFWKISRKQYGTARYFQALMRHNQERVPDPQKLRPGTQILTPPAAVLEQRYPDLIERPAPSAAPSGGSGSAGTRPRFEKPFSTADANDRTARPDGDAAAARYFYSKTGEPLYRIGADDTLTGIAQRHLGRASRWSEIYEKNQDVLKSPDNLTLGTVIRLPTDASRLSLVPDSDQRR